jgi:acyl-CoA thioesterase
MLARDQHAYAMGIKLGEVREGRATLTMTVREEMTNGHEIAHGGAIFSLADTAFACASNSRNEANVALQCSISFTKAARLGDQLTAVADERTASRGRTSAYDITVTRDDGTLIALFRGVAYRVKGAVLT